MKFLLTLGLTCSGLIGFARAAAPDVPTPAENWFRFEPAADDYKKPSVFDLRHLNEKEAGAGGFIGVKDGEFIHTKSGAPIRFWGVNGPASKGLENLQQEARLLARYGVNLVRIHHALYNERGDTNVDTLHRDHDYVDALRAEGIYSHISIYFPLWLNPAPGTSWLPGYDGKKHPFAALYFNKDFQARYRHWWKTILHTPGVRTGTRLVDNPAVMGLELVNEDSYFFWTFTEDNIPETELRLVETQFGDWLKQKHGSLDNALKAWGGAELKRDKRAEGRMAFRPLWNMAHERTPRDKDTAEFLLQSQRRFYQETYDYLRSLGFKGVITASNWATADPQAFGPLEKYSYTVGDFIDRHGYFAGKSYGFQATWSIRDHHAYADRSALRFDNPDPGKPRVFAHPAMDPHYDDKPSMISETTWPRPNRYRSEAPLFYAIYGALQNSNAIVHFHLDTAHWQVKPGPFMQPWTLMSPSMMGQFPAAAILYRKGLVKTGPNLVSLDLKIGDLLDLRGTPLPQDPAFDELRLKDVPPGTTLKEGEVIDPLVHYAGRTSVRFSAKGGQPKLEDLKPYIDRKRETVRAATGEVLLDYGKGVLTVDSPQAQGISGTLRAAGTTKLKDITITSGLDLGHIVAVSLDGEPLATSKKMLLQVMSEEKNNGFQTSDLRGGFRNIISIGHDPWLVRSFDGVVRFKRSDAAQLRTTALDLNGYPERVIGNAAEIRLQPRTLYYLIAP